MIGKTISHYKILEKLGEGGMGVVYKAQDTKLNRPVAIKFLPRQMTTAVEETKRFEREARAAAALNHPNIATVYAIEEREDEQLGKECFIAMEYIDGQELREKIKTSSLSMEQIIQITHQIAEGLNAAHKKGIVHRDIKSSNIMINRDGQVKIMDFGLAKLAGQTLLTKTGTTLGTVAYMSPEQARGEPVDQRSDIWSLGVIIYEMVTGQLPFKGEFDQAVIYSILNEEPEPVDNEITSELSNIISKSLKKDVKQRYQDISEVITELQRFAEPSKITFRPKYFKKRRYVYATVSVFVLCIIMFIAYWLFAPGKGGIPEWENSIAVLPFDNISADPEQEYFCDGMTEQIISNLSSSPRLKVITRTSVMKYKNTEKTITEIGKELNVSHILAGSIIKFEKRIRVTAQLVNTKNGFNLWSGNYDKEYRELFNVQDDISETIVNSLLKQLSSEERLAVKSKRPSNLEAYEFFLKGRHFHYVKSFEVRGTGQGTGEEQLKMAEEFFRKAIKLDPEFADSYSGLADIYNTFYNHFAINNQEKDYYWNLQQAYLDTALQLDPNSAEAYLVESSLHQTKANKYYKSGEFDKYEYELNAQYNSLRKSIKFNRNNRSAYRTLGRFFVNRGLYKLAIKCQNKAIMLDPLDYEFYFERGYAYHNLHEYNKVEADYKKALEFEPNSSYILRIYVYLLLQLKRYEEAERIVSKIGNIRPEWERYKSLRAILYLIKGEKEKVNEKDIQKYDMYVVNVMLKKKEGILNYLNEELEHDNNTKTSFYLSMKNNPFFDFISEDATFQQILVEHKEIYEENLNKYGDIDL